jgi:heparanase 1
MDSPLRQFYLAETCCNQGMLVTRLAFGVATLFSLAMEYAGAQPVALSPSKMPRMGSVDERFQSYNVEMIEVTGGRFWKPYGSGVKPPQGAPSGQIPADLYEYRPPTDLSNVRLRRLAAALGSAYVRVSGTWANGVYFHDSDDAAPQTPPAGFNGVLSRKQWKGVVDFARAANAKLATSFAMSPGTRDAAGVWTPEQARRFLAYTKAAGGSIAATEFMNEPNFAGIGSAPKDYDAAGYARDLAIFRKFLKAESPGTLLVGPGSVGEGGPIAMAQVPGRIKTEDMLAATGTAFDVFSYHGYAAVSQRCGGDKAPMGGTAADALTRDWLMRFEKVHGFYAALRDRFEPGKPLWNNETADAACGGNPWDSTFLDTFRYLNQHGRLAQEGVQVIAHNTLSASDYGLLDEHTFSPRPNYWGALLWRRLMGSIVLDPGVRAQDDLYVYAHCMRDQSGGVAVLAINAGASAKELDAPLAGERYALTSKERQSATVELNGHELQAGADGSLPRISGVAVKAGRLSVPPTSITFVVFPKAANPACR